MSLNENQSFPASVTNLAELEGNDPEVFAALCGEETRERNGIELIPSENYTFPEVLACLGSVFTNKYLSLIHI